MVRLTNRPDMTIAVYRGCKTTTQQWPSNHLHRALRKKFTVHKPHEMPLYCIEYKFLVVLPS